MHIGLFGGTFNPVHYGHLLAAQHAMSAAALDRVLFVPNRTPPHRRVPAGVGYDQHRYDMLVLATASHPCFYVSRVELERREVSYSVDTVGLLLQQHPHDQLSFITGTDAILRYTWKDFDRLLGMLEAFLVVSRGEAQREDLEARIDSLGLVNRATVRILETPRTEVSSTLVRANLRAGRSITYLVPEPVEHHIRKHHLYQEAP